MRREDTLQPDRSSTPLTTALASIQWLFFMFANIVVIPISIGQAFHLPPAVVTASLERAFIWTVICIAANQCWRCGPICSIFTVIWSSPGHPIKGMVFSYKSIYRIATPVLLGLALMAVPPTAFSSIPALIRTLVQNGLVMGILVAMILEHTIRWDKQK